MRQRECCRVSTHVASLQGMYKGEQYLEAAQDLLYNGVKEQAVVVAVAAQLHIGPAHGCKLGSAEAGNIVLHHIADLQRGHLWPWDDARRLPVCFLETVLTLGQIVGAYQQY